MLLATSQAIELADGVGRGAGHGGGGGFFLFPLLMFALLGFLLFRLARRGRHAAFAMAPGGALNTLSDRFARGEISREEFEYRRAILRNDKDVPAPPPFTAPPASSSAPPPPSPEPHPFAADDGDDDDQDGSPTSAS